MKTMQGDWKVGDNLTFSTCLLECAVCWDKPKREKHKRSANCGNKTNIGGRRQFFVVNMLHTDSEKYRAYFEGVYCTERLLVCISWKDELDQDFEITRNEREVLSFGTTNVIFTVVWSAINKF